MPDTENLVGDSTAKVMPSGASIGTGWVSERELEVLALESNAVTDAVDLHFGGVTVGHTGDQVLHQRARKTVQCTATTFVVWTGDAERSVLVLLDGDRLCDGEAEGALRPLDRDVLAVDRHVDTGGDGNGNLSDTRHCGGLPYQT
jgi:hypothetical protein